jgi:hypothetical protein
MTSLDIAHQRLYNQHLVDAPFEKPDDVVRRLGAVQAQDYAAAKWAIAQRTQGVTDAAIDQAFADGAILRTHVMRPTWHFVTPADIRWMLMLTAPRVNAVNAYYYRKLELDEVTFARSNAVLIKALQGGKQLTRPELASILQQAGIATDNLLRLGYLIIRAELDGIVCSGALRGKQHTHALLDERAPQARTLDHDEALVELTRRYFTSHGPATVQDFVWWSGLTTAEARTGLEMAKSWLAQEVIGGQTYWLPQERPAGKNPSPTAYLLPNYDEYLVGYKDRSASLDPAQAKLTALGNAVFNHVIVIDGRVVGTWKRTLKKETVIITPSLFTPLGQVEEQTVAEAARRYGAFLEMTVTLG